MSITGSLSGGENFKAKLESLVKAVAPGAGRTVQVGFLKGSICGINNDQDAPTIAFFNEYGTIGRQTLDTFSAERKVSKGGTVFKKGRGGRISVVTKQSRVKNRTSQWHIPPRPFFRNMISKNSPNWGKLLAACLKHQDFSVQQALAEAGLKMHEQLQQSIEEFSDPANAPATIKAKGFNAPLQHSKNMKRAVWLEVTDGGA